MAEIKNRVPKRRFKEFQDGEAWEECKLSSFCSMHARIGWQNLRTSEFLDSGDYYLITGTDFDDGRIKFDTCHYIDKDRYNQDRKIQVDNGSILITKDGTLGKVAYVQGLDKPATLNVGVFNVTINSKKADGKFLFQYLKAPFLMDYVSSKATGGTIKHLNQNILVDFPVILPEVEEQKAIGVYFSELDKLITLQQRKLEKIKSMKKAYLSEMFPAVGESRPKRRFKGFTEDWVERKLEDGTIKIGDGLHGTPRYSKSGNVFFVNGNNFINGNILYTKDTKCVTEEEQSLDDKLLNENTILMSINGTIGSLAFYKGEKIMLGKSAAFITVRDFDKKFLYSYLQTSVINNYFMNSLTGTTIKNLGLKAIRETQIFVPDIEEQRAIGKYFSKLDNLITLHQKKLSKLKNLKKSYLNEMFI